MLRALPAALLLAACTGVEPPPVPPDDIEQSHAASWDVPIASPTPLDVVFVIDEAPELAPYAQKVMASYGEMLHSLDDLPYGRPDLHLAVLTSAGSLFRTSDAFDGRFLVDEVHEDYRHVTNYRGSLANAFASAATVTGSSSTSPGILYSLAWALHNPGNDGFVRRNGVPLYIVIVTARDDVSPDSPETYAEWVRCVPSPVADYVAVSIARVGATPRLDAFAAAFPATNAVLALPDDDPAELLALAPLLQARPFITTQICADVPADLDAETPGIQTDCTAEVTHFGSLEGTALPNCDTTDGPCWYWRLDEIHCSYGDHPSARVGVDFKDAMWPRNSRFIGQCVTRS